MMMRLWIKNFRVRHRPHYRLLADLPTKYCSRLADLTTSRFDKKSGFGSSIAISKFSPTKVGAH